MCNAWDMVLGVIPFDIVFFKQTFKFFDHAKVVAGVVGSNVAQFFRDVVLLQHFEQYLGQMLS